MTCHFEEHTCAEFARYRCLRAGWVLASLIYLLGIGLSNGSEIGSGATAFRTQIRPFLEEFCFDCHGDGSRKGNVAFDEFTSDQAAAEDRQLWLRALKNLRAGLMPPPRKTQPTQDQKDMVVHWIKSDVFQADPQNPDPGRVTLRRLNRTEYRNTVRDLMGVDFETDKEFPPDDAGFGFDNIADVLTLPPMLLEKYLAAAKTIVGEAVPDVPLVPAERLIPGKEFRPREAESTTNRPTATKGGLSFSYYYRSEATNLFRASYSGSYKLLLDLTTTERFVDNQFDTNKCRFVFSVDGRELFQHEYTREGTKAFHYEFDTQWAADDHELQVEVIPLTPGAKQVRALSLRLDSVTVRGPLETEHWVRDSNGNWKYKARHFTWRGETD